MSSFSGLLSRIKKCQKLFNIQNPVHKESIVYMDSDGNILWEDGVEYNESGVLVIPLEMTIDEWEEENIKRDNLREKKE